MDQIRENINQILQYDSSDRVSLFQLQCFVLGKEPTIQAKLHQCIRELRSRKQSLDAIELEIGEQQDQLALLDIAREKILREAPTDDLDIRQHAIRIRQTERKMQQVENQLFDLNQRKKNIEEETLFFLTAFDQISKREAVKQWDDPDVQKEYWDEKLRQEVNMRLLLRQLPDPELMRTIMALHDDSVVKRKTIEMLNMYNKQVALAQKETPALCDNKQEEQSK